MLSQFWNGFGGRGCLILQIYMPHPIKFSSLVSSTGFTSQLYIKHIDTIQWNTLEEQPVYQMHKMHVMCRHETHIKT